MKLTFAREQILLVLRIPPGSSKGSFDTLVCYECCKQYHMRHSLSCILPSEGSTAVLAVTLSSAFSRSSVLA